MGQLWFLSYKGAAISEISTISNNHRTIQAPTEAHQGSASQRRAKTGKFLCVHGPDDSESLDVIMEGKLKEMKITIVKKIAGLFLAVPTPAMHVHTY